MQTIGHSSLIQNIKLNQHKLLKLLCINYV